MSCLRPFLQKKGGVLSLESNVRERDVTNRRRAERGTYRHSVSQVLETRRFTPFGASSAVAPAHTDLRHTSDRLVDTLSRIHVVHHVSCATFVDMHPLVFASCSRFVL